MVSVWFYKGWLVFLFDGIEIIEVVEWFEWCEVVVFSDDCSALESGEYFLSDLVGCSAVDCATGNPLKRITD